MPPVAVDIIKKIKDKKQEERKAQFKKVNKKGKEIHKLMANYLSGKMSLNAPDSKAKAKTTESTRQGTAESKSAPPWQPASVQVNTAIAGLSKLKSSISPKA